MNHDLIAASSTLDRDATRRLAARTGERIECLAGTLWITQDGDPRDVVLGAGDAFDFDRTGVALVSALAGGARYLRLGAGAATAAAA